MTTINLPRAVLEQALEAMRCAVPTGKITLADWHKSIAELEAVLAQQVKHVAWANIDSDRLRVDPATGNVSIGAQQAEQTWVCPEAPEERTYQKPGHCENCGKTLVLAQPNPPGCDHCNHPLYAATKCRVCGRVTEQAEPVEPVATVTECEACFTPDVCQLRGTCDYYTASQMRIAAPPQQAEAVQEPVAVFDARWGQPVLLSGAPLLEDEQPLYTAPPQRKPLTDEEIRDLWSWSMTAEAERTATTQQHAFTRAVERAHGIKE